jgi:DNA-directed RNA polymerase specialized sigma24 family protein
MNIAMEALQPSRFRVSEAGRRAKGSKRLIVALRSGDRAAAERLVEQTYEQVFASLCRMCGDRELAADLTQDTYARAWRSLDSFEGRCQFFTWLYRIAYTTFLNHVRKPQRLQTLSDSVVDILEDLGVLPDSEIVGKLDAARLRGRS